jgi:hypothetical protein
MTRPPVASIRAAADITSITMKGGTSLRREGARSCRAVSSMSRFPEASRLAPLPPQSQGSWRCVTAPLN